MLREAKCLMEDAGCLRSKTISQSKGAYLLELLALEILLKCCVVIETEKLEHGHDYVQVFLKLNRETRETLIQSAADRMSTNADYADIYWLLSLYGSNFTRMRYPYEQYGRISEAEYLRLGSEWIERGALTEEAKFDFRPNELYGLLYALSTYADAKIKPAQ